MCICDVSLFYSDFLVLFFFFQAEDGIRDAQESRGLGDVYKRQRQDLTRVGLVAADNFSVASPVDQLTKTQVRAAARAAGLPNWEVAASPCLRSRLAFGVEATATSLGIVEKGERLVRAPLKLHHTDNLRLRILGPGRAAVGASSASVS
eukprot:TRINITY_DN12394_c0_g1_i1.p1 TRINITY_DN12394_c0_g1~~TRINITY_DN12394_c0_g1_i1.p1  ORF type:complete len:149 (-),score=36.44 TRINITY_DN12394_c0_g1_i1:541-987(-)